MNIRKTTKPALAVGEIAVRQQKQEVVR